VRTDVANRITNALLPPRCAGCGRAGEVVCRSCARGLRCAPRLPVPAGVDAWVAPFAYEGVARELVARVKYRNHRAPLPWLAAAMAGALSTAGLVPGPERATVVTWAPASAQRRRERGFDHGELLARAVARHLVLPARGLLTRAAGPAQTGRSRAERGPGPPLRLGRPGPAPASVLLVDDVVTTGATLAAAAAVLRAAGARRVVAATAAATPHDRR